MSQSQSRELQTSDLNAAVHLTLQAGNADLDRCIPLPSCHTVQHAARSDATNAALHHESPVAVDIRYIVEMQRIYSSYFRSWHTLTSLVDVCSRSSTRAMRILFSSPQATPWLNVGVLSESFSILSCISRACAAFGQA